MKKLVILLFLFTFSNLYSSEVKFEKIFDDLKSPWSLSFIDKEKVIITEKTGKLLLLNLKNKNKKEIKHNLSLISLGQGGLLDVLYDNNKVYISYSENRGNWETSTSVAKGIFDKNKIVFKNIFRAPPTTLSKDETNRHQRSSLLSELSGEARLLERRRRREQRNEERKQRIEERINNASPKKSTTANRLDPLAWRSLEGMVGGRVYQPQDRIVHRKKRVEVTEISTPRKGRRPWSMKNDDTHLKICMYAAAKTTKVPSPSSSKTTYTKGPMLALLQPTLVV